MTLATTCRRLLTPAATALRRYYSPTSDSPRNRVAILGACGGLGQPLSLIMKRSEYIAELALYDKVDTAGLCADLSHISTKAAIKGYQGGDQLGDCLTGCSVVVMIAGIRRQPGMHRDSLFQQNATIVAELTDAVAKHCPKAQLCILTNPINSNVPLAAEILKHRGVHDPRRLYGITTVDSVRADVVYAKLTGHPLDKVSVPVLGGHSGHSLVPAFSQAQPPSRLSPEDVRRLTESVRGAADAIVAVKAGGGSATLSVAAAAHRFVNSVLLALDGRQNIIESAFVESDAMPDLPFFSCPLLLGQNGVERNLGVGQLSEYEAELMKAAVAELRVQIEKGQEFGLAWAKR
ncbi:hypothetical protein BOX15_Mlig005603g1 [Macrostomum lignano]|uniref:Malate dehydrogenase, mitochondrial n=2 Tax=Macrostomum lignano TaxID=282301 RepID=A0A267GCK9_9PLAT|nr:hypothetical protein BOX15_Mlig005603g1 [Macrostomum lignano]